MTQISFFLPEHLEQEQTEMRKQLVQAHSSIKFFTVSMYGVCVLCVSVCVCVVCESVCCVCVCVCVMG